MRILASYLLLILCFLLSSKSFGSCPPLERDLKLQLHGKASFPLDTLFPNAAGFENQKISYLIVASNAGLTNGSDALLVNGARVAYQTIRTGLLDYTYLQSGLQTWAVLGNTTLEFDGDLFVDSLSVVFE